MKDKYSFTLTTLKVPSNIYKVPQNDYGSTPWGTLNLISRYLYSKVPSFQGTLLKPKRLKGTLKKLKVPSRCALNVSRYLQGTLNWHSRYLRTVLVHHLEVPWTSSRYLEKSQGTTLNLKVPIRSPYRYLEIQGGTFKVPWKRSRYLEGVSQKLPQGTLRRLKVVRFSHYVI